MSAGQGLELFTQFSQIGRGVVPFDLGAAQMHLEGGFGDINSDIDGGGVCFHIDNDGICFPGRSVFQLILTHPSCEPKPRSGNGSSFEHGRGRLKLGCGQVKNRPRVERARPAPAVPGAEAAVLVSCRGKKSRKKGTMHFEFARKWERTCWAKAPSSPLLPSFLSGSLRSPPRKRQQGDGPKTQSLARIIICGLTHRKQHIRVGSIPREPTLGHCKKSSPNPERVEPQSVIQKQRRTVWM